MSEKFTREWIHESGTGEQAQERVFVENLSKIRKELDFAISDYQTGLIDPNKVPITEVLNAAKKLIDEIDKISEADRTWEKKTEG